MRASPIPYAILAGWVLVLASAALAGETPDDLRAEVYSLLEDQVAAWNRGDLDAFCSVYAEDALFLSPSGLTRGRQPILERYRRRYGEDRGGMGRLSLEPLEFQPIADAGATVAARWKLAWEDREDAEGLTLVVLRREGDRWTIVQDASM